MPKFSNERLRDNGKVENSRLSKSLRNEIN